MPSPYSYVIYPVSGTDYVVPFPYIDRSHIYVYRDGALLTLGVDYSWLNSTTVRLVLATGAFIEIRRKTSWTSRLTDYQIPGSLTEEELDVDSLQAFYMGQEAVDIEQRAVTRTASLDIDAQSHKVINVSNGENPGDAVNKSQLDSATIAAGNVTAPILSDVGKFLKAVGAGVWQWVSVALSFADISGTALVSQGGTGATDAPTAFSNLKQAATTAQSGVVELATQSEVNTGAAGVVPTADQLSAAPFTGRRNLLINGDFQVWQRGAGGAAVFNNPAAGAFVADRWRAWTDAVSPTFSVSQYTLTQSQRNTVQALTGSAPMYALRWNHTVLGTGATYRFISQAIENLRRFQNTKVRVSFVGWADQATQLSVGLVHSYGTGGSPSSEDSASVAAGSATPTLSTTPQRFSVTFSVSDFNAKTFGTINDNLRLQISIPLQLRDVYITDVQVEIGEVTTPFERRSFIEEYIACLRYYWKTFPYAVTPVQAVGSNTNTLEWRTVVGASATSTYYGFTPVPMRVAGTITGFNPVSANAQVRNNTAAADCSATSVAVSDRGLIYVTTTNPAGGAANNILSFHITIDADL